MGRTPTPLVIWIDDAWVNHPQIVELGAKGHAVLMLSDVMNGCGTLREGKSVFPDLILSRASWSWSNDMWPMLEVTLRAARLRKKEA